ncbi:cysteine hydrolase family protein [Photobacterium nomapromontoriensis]|uniref:cysteine hydrolase family protein n=1 Tax=Photobacterium nomapromontoriensis TaxID=2910237 RepID=UPI003D1532EC
MAITTLDTHTALIVIDLQKGIIALDTCHPVQPVIHNACKLIEAFRHAQLPVVLVNVAGAPSGRTEQIVSNVQRPNDWSDLSDDITPESSDHLITKTTWGAFTNTDLDQYLTTNNITQVVIVGIATSIGVESTARQAWECGYNITLPTDAMTDLNLAAHNNSLNNIFPRLSETGITQDVLSLIQKAKNAYQE